MLLIDHSISRKRAISQLGQLPLFFNTSVYKSTKVHLNQTSPLASVSLLHTIKITRLSQYLLNWQSIRIYLRKDMFCIPTYRYVYVLGIWKKDCGYIISVSIVSLMRLNTVYSKFNKLCIDYIKCFSLRL